MVRAGKVGEEGWGLRAGQTCFEHSRKKEKLCNVWFAFKTIYFLMFCTKPVYAIAIFPFIRG